MRLSQSRDRSASGRGQNHARSSRTAFARERAGAGAGTTPTGRRLAARRVAHERGERIGETIGYQVRFEEVAGARTRLRFLTEGILTRRLISDPQLAGVDVVVLDEFHERHLESDLALALLRRLQSTRRPDLRLIVMSATLDTGPVARYLGGCPILRSEGRLFDLSVTQLGSFGNMRMEPRAPFTCPTCENHCEIQRVVLNGKAYPFGGLCSKWEMVRRPRGIRQSEGRDLVALRHEMMFKTFAPPQPVQPRGRIGLPLALTTYELYPLYARFLTELGYGVVLSRPGLGHRRTGAPMCYPSELMHAAVDDLLTQVVDLIFLPYMREFPVPEGHAHGYPVRARELDIELADDCPYTQYPGDTPLSRQLLWIARDMS